VTDGASSTAATGARWHGQRVGLAFLLSDDSVLVEEAARHGIYLLILDTGRGPADHRAAASRLGGNEISPGAEPLVVLPGMLGDADVWADAAALLAEDRSVQVGRIDLDDSVAGAAASVLATAPPRFALAGHSLGGIVAFEIVRQAPSRVSRLALLNTSARPGSEEQQAAWSRLRQRVEDGDFPAIAQEMARATLPDHRHADAELVARGERSAAVVGATGLLRQLAAQATRPDSRPELSSIRVPTVVVTGADDQISPAELQEELAAAIPGAVHQTLKGVGHMAPIEAPAAVAEVLATWLE
jgi:pimeloyl-ACP methyl ester carboxylesterase